MNIKMPAVKKSLNFTFSKIMIIILNLDRYLSVFANFFTYNFLLNFLNSMLFLMSIVKFKTLRIKLSSFLKQKFIIDPI